MKYKPGDKVRIKSLDWYNTFKDDFGIVDCGQWYFDKKMSRFCGKIVTICESDDMFNWYRISEENDQHIRYNNNMIEGLADEPQEKMVSLDKVCKWLRANIDLYADTRRSLFSNYQEVYLTDNFETEFRKAMGE